MSVTSTPVPVPIADLPLVDTTDVRQGDLVFCSRPGLLQRFCRSAGELWRHVGIALLLDDGEGMGIVEVDGDRFVTRPIDKVQQAYAWVAIARVADDDGATIESAVNWARHFVGSGHAYAWDDAVVAGFLALTRFHLGDSDPDLVATVVRRASAAAAPRWLERRVTHTCSSFVYFAFNAGGNEQRLIVDLEISQRVAAEAMNTGRVPELRAGRGSRIDAQQLAEAARVVIGAIGGGREPGPATPEAMGRWVMPGDIWRSPSIDFRARLRTRLER